MDEKQLQFLYESLGKNQGFKDYNQFKSLLSNSDLRKSYFDMSNKDMGFKDYNEFESVVGFKKKEKENAGSSENQNTSLSPSNSVDSISDFDSQFRDSQAKAKAFNKKVVGFYDVNSRQFFKPTNDEKNLTPQTEFKNGDIVDYTKIQDNKRAAAIVDRMNAIGENPLDEKGQLDPYSKSEYNTLNNELQELRKKNAGNDAFSITGYKQLQDNKWVDVSRPEEDFLAKKLPEVRVMAIKGKPDPKAVNSFFSKDTEIKDIMGKYSYDGDQIKDFLFKRKAIIPALKELSKANPGELDTEEGRERLMSKAIDKTYGVSDYVFNNILYPGVDQKTYEQNIQLLKDSQFNQEAPELGQKAEELRKKLDDLEPLVKTSKDPSVLKSYQTLAGQYNSIVDRYNSLKQEVQPIFDYFDRPENKALNTRIERQKEGSDLMGMVPRLFSKNREAREEVANNGRLLYGLNLPLIGPAANTIMRGITGIAESGVQLANTFGIKTGNTMPALDKFSKSIEVSIGDKTGSTKYGVINFAKDIVDKAGGLAPYLIPYFGEAAFTAGEAGNSIVNAKRAGINDNVQLLLSGAATALINKYAAKLLPHGGRAIEGYNIDRKALSKFLDPATREEGAKMISDEASAFLLKKYRNQVAEGAVHGVSALKIMETGNAINNALLNHANGTELNTDVSFDLNDMVKELATMGIVSSVTSAGGYLDKKADYKPDAVKEFVLKKAVEDYPFAIKFLDNLKRMPNADPETVQEISDTVAKITGLRFPDDMTSDQKVATFNVINRINTLKNQKSKSDAEFHGPIDKQIKDLESKMTEFVNNPEKASEEVKNLMKPLEDDVNIKLQEYAINERGQGGDSEEPARTQEGQSEKGQGTGAERQGEIPQTNVGDSNTRSSGEIEAKKADIEQRRQEEIDSAGDVESWETPKAYDDFIGNINAKYDAELAKLESSTVSENKKTESTQQANNRPKTTEEAIKRLTPEQKAQYVDHIVNGRDEEADAMLDVEPEPAKVYTVEDIDSVDTSSMSDVQKKNVEDAKGVLKAVSGIFPGVQLHLHNNEGSYGEAVVNAGSTRQNASSKGFYLGKNGTIHLNLGRVTTETMLHEGFHPILDFIASKSPEKVNQLFSELESINGTEDLIARNKEIYGEGNKKEAITDFFARVRDGQIKIDPSNFDKVKEFVAKVFDTIGLTSLANKVRDMKGSLDLSSASELKKLIDSVGAKFEKGEKIEASDLESYTKKAESPESSDGVDTEVDLSDVETSDRGIQFSKDDDETLRAVKTSIISHKDLGNVKVARTLFYDNTRVGKLEIKNRLTGYTPDVDGKGGFFYSYMPEAIKNKAVLAFTSVNQAIQTLQRQMMYPDGVQAVAAQNVMTAHLGNKSTLKALFGEPGSKKLGIFQEAAKGKVKAEKELVDVLMSSVKELSEKRNLKTGEMTPEAELMTKVLEKAGKVKTLDEFRDKILIGDGDSFGTRNTIFQYIFQEKATKITKATRDSHNILHYKYGIPTLSEIANGNNQKQLNNAETGDVVKLVKPYSEPIIYTTVGKLYEQYKNNPTPEMVRNGIKIELLPEELNHESYPFVLRGENVGVLNNYIAATHLYEEHKDLPKKQGFYTIGRMKKDAAAGEIKAEIETQGVPQFSKDETPIINTVPKKSDREFRYGKDFTDDWYDFTYDLQKALGKNHSLNNSLGYSRNGNTIIRVKDHFSNPNNFDFEVDDKGAKNIVDIIVPMKGEGLNENDDFNDYIKEKGVNGIQIFVEDGTWMSDIVNKVKVFLNDSKPQFSKDENTEIVNGFYSPIENKVNEFKQPNASATKWIEMLGKKSDEAVYSGLADWLGGMKPDQRVSKEEVLKFMKDNRIEIKEIYAGGVVNAREGEIADRLNEIQKEYEDKFGNKFATELAKNDEYYNLEKEWIDIQKQRRSTNYSNYQLPGGDNYKEVLITLPSKLNSNDEARLQELIQKKRDRSITLEEENEFQALDKRLGGDFQSSHFDEPNIITHLRMNTRTDADGKKVLFLEEVQSDWGQKGKKVGFKKDYSEDKRRIDTELGSVNKKLDDALNEMYNAGLPTNPSSTQLREFKFGHLETKEIFNLNKALDKVKNNREYESLNNEVLSIQSNQRKLYGNYEKILNKKIELENDLNKIGLNETANFGINKAPYVTNTNAWVKLGLKVALKEAVKQNADRIAWTTGEQQNERYDLGASVKYVDYDKIGDKYDFRIRLKDGGEETYSSYTLKDVEDTLGKDIANRMANNEGSDEYNDSKRLEGENLKVGGKGMKSFYGNAENTGIVGNVAKALVKELTGKEGVIFNSNINNGEKGKFYDELSQKQTRIDEIELRQKEIEKNLTNNQGDTNALADEYNSIQNEKQDLIQEVSDLKRRTSEKLREDNRGKSFSSQPAIEITPELKAAVQGGMPQFSKADRQAKLEDLKRKGLISEDEFKSNMDKLDKLLPNPTGIANAVVNKEREERGLEPLENRLKGSFSEWYNSAKEKIEQGSIDPISLAREIAHTPRPISTEEVSALTYGRMRLMNERNLIERNLEEADKSGNQKNADALRYRLAEIEQDIEFSDNASNFAGTISGQVLGARRMMLADDYSLANMERRLTIANKGKRLPREVRIKLEKLDSDLKEAQLKLDEYEKLKNVNSSKEAAEEQLKKIIELTPKTSGKRDAQRAAILDRIKQRIESKNKPEFSRSERVNPLEEHKDDIMDLVKSYIADGVRDPAELMQSIYDEFSLVDPNLNVRDLQDIISGYGKTSELSQEPLTKALRDIKAQLRLISAIQDVEEGKLPKKSGLQRDNPIDEIRNLRQQLNDKLKEFGLNDIEADSEKKYKTALQAAKKRLLNQIVDLENQIDTGERRAPKKGIEYDQEAIELRNERDRLKGIIDEIDGNNGMTYEQKVRVATAAVNRSITELGRRISEKDFSKTDDSPISTPELEILREQQRKLREEYEALKEAEGVTEKEKLSRYKKVLEKRKVEYEKRIKEGDFSKKKPKATVLDEEAMRLKKEVEDVKFKFDKEKLRIERENRTPLDKKLDNFLRARREMLLSAVATLGKIATAGSYIIAAKPMESAVGSVLNKLPILKKVAAKAPREGGGFSAKAEAKAITEVIKRATLEDIGRIMKGQKSILETAYGKKVLTPEETSFFGSLHAVLKYAPKKGEIFRSMEYRFEHARKNGEDITNPAVTSRIITEAILDGNKEIFMGDNYVVDAYKAGLRTLKSKDNIGAKALAFSLETLLAVVKVPTNYVKSTGEYLLGAGVGTLKLATSKIKDLSPQEADLIMRLMKKGALGASAFAIGFFNPNNVGGYYAGKRDDGDLKEGELEIFGVKIPKWATHHPLIEVMQFGSTVRRYLNAQEKAGEEKTPVMNTLKATGHLVGEVPFLSVSKDVTEAMEGDYKAVNFVGALASSIVVPPDVKRIAKATDKQDGETVKRRTTTILEKIQEGIPGLRNKLPEDPEAKKTAAREKIREMIRSGEYKYISDIRQAYPDLAETADIYNDERFRKSAEMDKDIFRFHNNSAEKQIKRWSALTVKEKEEYGEYVKSKKSLLRAVKEKPEILKEKRWKNAYEELINIAEND